MARKRSAKPNGEQSSGGKLFLLIRPDALPSPEPMVDPAVRRRSFDGAVRSGAALSHLEADQLEVRDTIPDRDPFVPAAAIAAAPTAGEPVLSGNFAAFCARGEQLERAHLDRWDDGELLSAGVRTAVPPERRARLRWIAGAILIAAMTLLVSGGVKAAGRYRAKQARVPPPRDNNPVALADPALQDPVQPAPPAVLATATPAASAIPAASPADGAAARKRAERLLNMGRLKQAIPAAESAIEADPEHAMGYLLLGSALQSTGRWKDGLAAYSKCVHRATRGPVGECRALGGR